MVTNTPSASSLSVGSPSRLSTVASSAVRTPSAAADLRWSDRRQDQRPAAQVAPPPPSPLHRGRSLRRLPLRYLDPPSRILLNSSARSTGPRPLVLRERNP